MAPFLAALVLAASFDAEAALRHASALAALGPHPWGSTRGAVAATYVAAEFRAAGLDEVRVEPYESQGIRGTNVVGVLRAPGPEFLVLGAHHDTAPEAPGAYDDGGGVGVLIEAARVLAAQPQRPRTVVFVSWDGEEAWSTGKTTTSGSRAYIQSLGAEARHLVAALDVEMCGWKGGAPVFHPIAYADPLRPGRSVIAPGWLLRAAQRGAQSAGVPLPVGDPLLSWIYQPAVRAFRVHLYGDDLSFLQAGLPALFVSDSSFSAYYPWYHAAQDTSDKLDKESLDRMGRAVIGMVVELSRVAPGPAQDPRWFAAFGRTAGAAALWLALAATLLPGLSVGLLVRGRFLAARAAQALLLLAVAWEQPLLVAWCFLLANLLSAVVRRLWATLLGLLPLLALLALGALAALRGFVGGTWLAPWQILALGAALLLVFVPAPGGAPARGASRGPRRRGGSRKG